MLQRHVVAFSASGLGSALINAILICYSFSFVRPETRRTVSVWCIVQSLPWLGGLALTATGVFVVTLLLIRRDGRRAMRSHLWPTITVGLVYPFISIYGSMFLGVWIWGAVSMIGIVAFAASRLTPE